MTDLTPLHDAATKATEAFNAACVRAGFADSAAAYKAHPDGIFADCYEVWPAALILAHQAMTNALHAFYLARDGERGFLGGRGA